MKQLQYCTIRQLYKQAMHLWARPMSAGVGGRGREKKKKGEFKQLWTEATWRQVNLIWDHLNQACDPLSPQVAFAEVRPIQGQAWEA